MTNRFDDVTNAKFLADSYKVTSREELVDVYDQWADLYDEHANIRNSAQPSTVAKVFLDTFDNKNISVLDIGAGTGLIGEALKENGFSELSALDSSQKMLDVAKNKGIYNSYHQVFLGEVLPFKNGSCESVVASGIFTVGHVDASAFSELNRILKAGGKMIFSLNLKLLKDESFYNIIYEGVDLNWKLECISPEFDMMRHEFSTAKAVVVVLSKINEIR